MNRAKKEPKCIHAQLAKSTAICLPTSVTAMIVIAMNVL